MDHKEQYEKARAYLIEYLNIEDPNLINNHQDSPLSDLVDMFADKYNDNLLYGSLMEIAYKKGLPYESFDKFLEGAETLLNEIDEFKELPEDELFKLVDNIKVSQ